jgi:IclR family transcriptional regulator, acetate operon repressor
MPTRPAYAITSVDNALRLIEMLQRDETLRVTDAAAEIGVAQSTAHRLLAMLCYRGFATRGGEHRYLPGPALLAADSAPAWQRNLRRRAQPFLEHLNAQTVETVHLIIRQGRDVVFIGGVESARPVRMCIQVGAVMPAHRTSGGQALLAELPAAELCKLYPAGSPDDLPVTAEGFSSLLRGVRFRGYGVVEGLQQRGMAALGTAVHGPSGAAVGAVCVAAPAQRLPKARRPGLARILRETAQRIEASLADAASPADGRTELGSALRPPAAYRPRAGRTPAGGGPPLPRQSVRPVDEDEAALHAGRPDGQCFGVLR